MALSYKLDPISYKIGMINCFIEMVACGVKPLAISPPIPPEELPLLEQASRELSEGFGTRYETVDSLMITDIQSEEFTRGKASILYYKNDTAIREYHSLARWVAALESQGRYAGQVRKEISWAFGKLLGYPDPVIRQKVEGDKRIDPVML